MTTPTGESGDRRKLLLLVTGGVVGLAVVIGVLVALLSGGDADDEPVAAPPVQPIALTAPADTSGVIHADGTPAELSQSDLDAALATVTGYLKEATITPLSTPPPRDAETTTTVAASDALRANFTPDAAANLVGQHLQAMVDNHLGFAKDGVSTTRLTVALAGIVEEGSARFLNATIDAQMVVRGESAITVTRRGELVLQPVDGQWRISAYRITAERAVGDQTTTSEATSG